MKTIALWNKCNNRCLMCSNPPGYEKGKGYDFKSLVLRFQKIDPGEKEIYLTGGEPTLHPQFFKLLTILRKRCPRAKIILDTNGRMFFYEDFLRECLGYGNLEFQVSLCAHTAFLHDKITQTEGSFEQTVKGIKNLLFLGSSENEVEIRVVIHKLTLPYLKEIYDFVAKNFPQIVRLIFIFMEMEGQAQKNIEKVGITYKKARPYMEDFFKKIKSAPFEIRLYHFPLCVLQFKFWPYLWRTLPEKEITFLKKCSQCLYQKYCLGIHRDYLKMIGGKEFKPIRKKIEIQETENFHHPIKSASKNAH